MPLLSSLKQGNLPIGQFRKEFELVINQFPEHMMVSNEDVLDIFIDCLVPALQVKLDTTAYKLSTWQNAFRRAKIWERRMILEQTSKIAPTTFYMLKTGEIIDLALPQFITNNGISKLIANLKIYFLLSSYANQLRALTILSINEMHTTQLCPLSRCWTPYKTLSSCLRF